METEPEVSKFAAPFYASIYNIMFVMTPKSLVK